MHSFTLPRTAGATRVRAKPTSGNGRKGHNSKKPEGRAAGRGATETADKIDVATSSRHRNIQPAVIGQEPDVATGIGAHKRHDDGLLFPPLEAIHRANLHVRVLRLDLSPQESHLRTLVVNICPAPLLM
jgi:hypothetical protein